ncbi:MAG: hypothetical protein IJN49_01030 [Clostridia bacterium]|nr:hypothetical protein [Clostridia bacterium]
MKQITVKELYKLCKEQIDEGKGNRMIVISDDNEGNGFHGMFYAFTDADEFIDDIHDSQSENPKKLIVLG